MGKTSEPHRCLRCGTKTVRPRTGQGRKTSFRVFPSLPIPNALPIPTCARCLSEYTDLATEADLTRELELVYLETLRGLASRAIRRLSRHISQRKLELRLGLSQGYLCRIAAGAGNPSPALVALLHLLVRDPVARLTEVEHDWSQTTLPDSESMSHERCKQSRQKSR